jgi:hypothetical protein
MYLIRDSFTKCVTQVFELVCLFYFSSFSVPLILFTLPLSLIFVFSTFTSSFFSSQLIGNYLISSKIETLVLLRSLYYLLDLSYQKIIWKTQNVEFFVSLVYFDRLIQVELSITSFLVDCTIK